MLIPHPKRVIVRPSEEFKRDADGNRRSGSIIIADTAKAETKKSAKGEIVAMPPLTPNAHERLNLAIGRVVHYSAYSANEIVFNGETLAAVELDDILAVEE